MTDVVVAALAALAVVSQLLLAAALVVVALAPVSAGAHRLGEGARAALAGRELWLAWVVALVATLGSLYFSEVADFVPCQLCWFQRIAMYPLAVTLFLAAVVRDRRGAYYSLALPLIGAAIAGRHIYVERNPSAESASCLVGAPCSAKWIEEFGYVTIPTLALTAFALIATLLLLAWFRPREEPA